MRYHSIVQRGGFHNLPFNVYRGIFISELSPDCGVSDGHSSGPCKDKSSIHDDTGADKGLNSALKVTISPSFRSPI